MNKRAIIVVVGIIALIGGSVGYVLLNKKDAAAPVVSDSTKQDTDSNDIATPSQPTKKGEYVDYSNEALRSASGTKLLFFHAPWCPQCRAIEESIEKNGIPSSVTVLKVDYDSNQALRQKYGVTLQTTFVKVDANGDKVKSYTAYEEPTFDAVKRELLP
jgi:thiol-disulfide isomerase/thioredoxin